MSFLQRERQLADDLLPGLLTKLDAISLEDKEIPGSETIEILRQANGPKLIIPENYGGMGVGPVEAVRFQRALAASAPSLALASNMQHFTVALLNEYATDSPQLRELLKTTAANNLYLASGFAEGATAQSTQTPKLVAEPAKGGYVLNGSKKPCSLAHSMDILTASVGITTEQGAKRFGIAIIPAKTEGVSVRPFWKSPIYAGTESEEVLLENVFVLQQNMFVPGDTADHSDMETGGFIWFQILTSSTYLGVGSALMALVLETGKGSVEGRVKVACELEAAMVALEGVAHSLQSGDRSDHLIAQSLFTRYAIQDALTRVVAQAAEMLGGVAFMSDSTISYLIAAVRCLAFHPPGRSSVSESLDNYLQGQPFKYV